MTDHTEFHSDPPYLPSRLFEDVGPMLRMLAEEGLSLYVYSSGSVQSQKLLFGNSTVGDLLDVSYTQSTLIQCYFWIKLIKDVGQGF